MAGPGCGRGGKAECFRACAGGERRSPWLVLGGWWLAATGIRRGAWGGGFAFSGGGGARGGGRSLSAGRKRRETRHRRSRLDGKYGAFSRIPACGGSTKYEDGQVESEVALPPYWVVR